MTIGFNEVYMNNKAILIGDIDPPHPKGRGFLLRSSLLRERLGYRRNCSHVGAFTATNQLMLPKTHTNSTGLKFRKPCGMQKIIQDYL